MTSFAGPFSFRRILDHVGEPSNSSCRGSLHWGEKGVPVFLDDVLQPDPEYPFDPTVSWQYAVFIVGH